MTDEVRSNIPIPDPSLATNERLAAARAEIEKRIERNYDEHEDRMIRNRTEVKGWVDALQVLIEAKLAGSVRVIETRLSGNDEALKAALTALKEVLSESKIGTANQLDALNKKIDEAKASISETGGHTQGASQMITMIIALLALAASVVASVLNISARH